jgi:phage shock protein E
MIESIKNLFGLGPQTDYAGLVKAGAQIVDVRTKGEFAGGNIRGSVNIPLDVLAANLSKLKKDKPVITCCASGMRSASAKAMLQANGFEAYNGGGWAGLNEKIKG